MNAVADIYESDPVTGLTQISPRKVMTIISERDELRCAVETMADDIATLCTELQKLHDILSKLKDLGDAAAL